MLTTGQLSAFLKSDQAKAAPSERTAQETAWAVKRTEDAIKETVGSIVRSEETVKQIGSQLIQQGQAVDGFAILTIAFLPLNFSASVFCSPSAI